jgi:hypothetical protein
MQRAGPSGRGGSEEGDVGSTFQYILIKPDPRSTSALPTELVEGFDTLGESETGWVFLQASQTETLTDLNKRMRGLAVSLLGPALAAFVEDSSYAFMSAMSPSQPLFSFMLNPSLAVGHKEGQWALEKCTDGAGAAAENMSAWSRLAPSAIEPEQVRALIDKEWVSADEGVEELLDLMGLPLPPDPALRQFIGALTLHDRGKFVSGRREVDIAESRYLVGVGSDFLGIWDRQSPGPPIRRYPRNSQGMRAVYEEWFRLARSSLEDVGRTGPW